MGVVKRMKQPTPRFFRKIRNIGIAAGTIGGAILTAPVALPAVLITAAGYMAVAGTVAATVSQAVTGTEDAEDWGDEVKTCKKKRK